MWIQDLQRALEILKQTYGSFLHIKDVKIAYDGIVFHCEDNKIYKYWNYSDSITKLETDWRKNRDC